MEGKYIHKPRRKKCEERAKREGGGRREIN